MLFLLRMLHRQLQRQVRLPEDRRARACRCSSTRPTTSPAPRTSSTRSPPTAPPAWRPRSGCSTSRSSAPAPSTRRRSARACSTCCRAGFLFRMGDAQDAEEATRIAMAVYATMIRDDPDSRARLRVTPEQALNFPNHYCLASWIATGTRIPSFMGQTYPFPPLRRRVEPTGTSTSQAAARRPLPRTARRHASTAPSPLAGQPQRAAMTRTTTASAPPARTQRRAQPAPTAPGRLRWPGRASRAAAAVTAETPSAPSRPGTRCASTTRRRPRRPSSTAARPPDRRTPAPDTPPRDPDDAGARQRCASSRSWTASTRSARPTQLAGATNLPRLYDEDYAILALLDRAGLAPAR